MDILEKLRQEGRVIKDAPFSFVIFIAIGLACGYGASTWYYSKQITDRGGQIARYRVALGIDKGSPSALAELTNAELQAKALAVAFKARDLCFSFQKREAQIPHVPQGNKQKGKQFADEDNNLMKDVGEEFDRGMKADFIGANNEILKRLDPKAASAVIRGPMLGDAETGTPIGMPGLTPDNMEAAFLCTYADQLEQLAKLLPADSPK